MFYTVYKITNLINGKIYIGVHKTNVLDDGYMGSGKIIKRSVEKYGIENFEKEILEVFDNPEEMFEMESTLVNEDFVNRKDTYNLKEGGFGGFDYINEHKLNDTEKNKLSRIKNLKKANKRKKELFELGLTRKGYHLSEEHKHKISKACKGLLIGEKNPMFGKKAINKDGVNKMVLEKDVENYILEGWKLGQIQKKPDITGNKNPQKGKIWITNGTDNKCLKPSDAVPFLNKGWFKGRNVKKSK